MDEVAEVWSLKRKLYRYVEERYKGVPANYKGWGDTGGNLRWNSILEKRRDYK